MTQTQRGYGFAFFRWHSGIFPRADCNGVGWCRDLWATMNPPKEST